MHISTTSFGESFVDVCVRMRFRVFVRTCICVYEIVVNASWIDSFLTNHRTCGTYLPKRCETAGEGSSCLIAMRSAIARAVSSGYGLQKTVDIKMVLVVLCTA